MNTGVTMVERGLALSDQVFLLCLSDHTEGRGKNLAEHVPSLMD